MNRNILVSLVLAALMIAFALLGRSEIISEKSADAGFWMLLGLAAGLSSGCLRRSQAC